MRPAVQLLNGHQTVSRDVGNGHTSSSASSALFKTAISSPARERRTTGPVWETSVYHRRRKESERIRGEITIFLPQLLKINPGLLKGYLKCMSNERVALGAWSMTRLPGRESEVKRQR